MDQKQGLKGDQNFEREKREAREVKKCMREGKCMKGTTGAQA